MNRGDTAGMKPEEAWGLMGRGSGRGRGGLGRLAGA